MTKSTLDEALTKLSGSFIANSWRFRRSADRELTLSNGAHMTNQLLIAGAAALVFAIASSGTASATPVDTHITGTATSQDGKDVLTFNFFVNNVPDQNGNYDIQNSGKAVYNGIKLRLVDTYISGQIGFTSDGSFLNAVNMPGYTPTIYAPIAFQNPTKIITVFLGNCGTRGYCMGEVVNGAPSTPDYNVPYKAGPAVPEPATWATVLLGFGLVGSQLRRSSRKLIPAAAA
jgi:hypothetical protein